MLLRDYLQQHGFTHERFADLVGVSRPAVSFWARGINRPNARAARLIAKITDGKVTAQDFQRAWEMAQ